MGIDGQTVGRTDRHDEANSRLSRFCGRACNSQHTLYFVTHDRILYVEIQQFYELASAFPSAASDDIAVHNSPVFLFHNQDFALLRGIRTKQMAVKRGTPL